MVELKPKPVPSKNLVLLLTRNIVDLLPSALGSSLVSRKDKVKGAKDGRFLKNLNSCFDWFSFLGKFFGLKKMNFIEHVHSQLVFRALK